MNESEIIKKINQRLIELIPSMNDVGLLEGKMGTSLYFFYAERIYKNEQYKEIAEKLLDEVIAKMQKEGLRNDFAKGLAGIGWGIEHLMQNGFIAAGDIFSEMDSRIFMHIMETENMSVGISGFAGYIHYLFARLKGVISNPAIRYHQHLVIELVNQLEKKLDTVSIFRDPLLFDIEWSLPLVLLSLSKAFEMNIYNTKIKRIIEQYSPRILAMFPNLHANRLYLLYAMQAITQHLSLRRWEEHITLLRQNISMPCILNEEMNDKNIRINNGISGIALICYELSRLNPENLLKYSFSEMEQKITNSGFWTLNDNDAGILHGYAGLGLALLTTKIHENE